MTDEVTIYIAPAPEGATPLHPDPNHGCTCSVLEGRCATHSNMMAAIHAAWNSDRTGLVIADIRSLADGYGYPGSMIDLGTYDWSGVRDSTEATIEKMFAAVTGSAR